MSNITEAELSRIPSENASERVQLICGKHRYVPIQKRANGFVAIPPNTSGCKDCWLAYYTGDLALTPPSKRKERLDELESVVRHAVEYAKAGKFGSDFELYEPQDSRFKVEIERDAADDETGADKVAVSGEEKLN